jgi:twitching motility protein PilT
MLTSDIHPRLEEFIQTLWDRKGTDLILTATTEPRIRVGGTLMVIDGSQPLESEVVDAMVMGLLSEEQKSTLKEQKDVDFSFAWGDQARIRGSAYNQSGYMAMALRIIPVRIPTIEELGLPPYALEIANSSKGFVLVTGPTGSGKSTTLAAIINHINTERGVHILTVEDPVEYVHKHKRAMVSQREVGEDTPSFARALRSALREDPDVLLVGEMRDNESIGIALTMAETGHLVLGTLHTNDAPQAIDRVIDVFPTDGQEQIRVQLGAALGAVIAQRLVPRIGGGLVAAYEVLVATHPVRNLIREGRTSQIPNTMTTSSKDGMLMMEKSLYDLIKSDTITVDDAMDVAPRPKELQRMLDGG